VVIKAGLTVFDLECWI